MKFKKINVVLITIILILLGAIAYLANNLLNKETKEVVIAKKFIEKLADDNMIKVSDYGNVVEDKVLNKLTSKSSQIQYSVMVGSYGVDIDKDYNILGFSNKGISKSDSVSIIEEKKAIELATKYIMQITNDNFKFKEVKNMEESPSYNIVFYKYKDGYPYYNQEIITAIDKETGKLEGYSNYPMYNIKYIEEVNIDEENASKIAKDYLNSINLNGGFLSSDMIGFISVSDNEMALAYNYNVKIMNSEDNEETYNIYVRADTGDVLNFNLQAISAN